MARLLHSLGLLLAAHASPESDAELDLSTVSLLQQREGMRLEPNSEHFWPHARGRVGRYSVTPYTRMPENLTANLLWKWENPHYNTIHWGTLIDKNKNIYLIAMDTIKKFSPSGEVIWSAMESSEMGTLVDNMLVGMRMMDCQTFALDLDTGKVLWRNKACSINGAHGDFVESHDGVAVVGAAAMGDMTSGGGASRNVTGLSIVDGKTLWSYEVECGLWDIMALFPGDDTFVFQDMCGGTYRMGLRNGTLLWHTSGEPTSFTDGGAMIDGKGDVYACSNAKGSSGQVSEKGLLTKFALASGEVLWRKTLDYPCVNFPAVSADGKTVVVAPGALAGEAATRHVDSVREEERPAFFEGQKRLAAENKQREAFGQPNLAARVMGLDAETGQEQWRHEVYPYGGMAFAGDEQRAWNYAQRDSLKDLLTVQTPHCWPAHWSAPTLDLEGNVYIGRSSGEFLAYNPRTKRETSFKTEDGILMAGGAFAPGLMAFATCSSVFAFEMPQA